MSTKERVRELAAQGMSAPQIQKELGLAKSTVHHHLSDTSQRKTTERTKRLRQQKPGLGKLYSFLTETRGVPRKPAKHRRKSLTNKSRAFQQRTKIKSPLGYHWTNFQDTTLPITFSFDRIVELHPEQKCYLSGRTIDFTKTESFSFDHIVPVSKGGFNTLENLGVTCPKANQAKNDSSVEEFIELCKDVLQNFGFIIVAPSFGLEPKSSVLLESLQADDSTAHYRNYAN